MIVFRCTKHGFSLSLFNKDHETPQDLFVYNGALGALGACEAQRCPGCPGTHRDITVGIYQGGAMWCPIDSVQLVYNYSFCRTYCRYIYLSIVDEGYMVDIPRNDGVKYSK